MNYGKELDSDFWEKSKDFFHHFQKQVDLIQELFTEVANAFPQERLIQYFNNSKGCRVSKGSQLESLPYQVLDIVRDFDQKGGFNIRFLNWWGNGFYVFVTYGHQIKNNFSTNRIPFFQNFNLYFGESPFDYREIVKSQLKVSAENLDAAFNSSCQLVIWQKIKLHKDPKATSDMMVKLTEDILSYHIS